MTDMYREWNMQNMALRQREKHAQQWHCKRSVTETFVCQYRDLCYHKYFNTQSATLGP